MIGEHDLEYLINLVYNFYYNKKFNECVNTLNISLEDANEIENIKYVPSSDQIDKWINQIFNVDIIYDGKNDNKYAFTRVSTHNCIILIKKYDIQNSSEENNDKKISFLLSDFVTKKFTRHILLPIMHIDIPAKKLMPFLRKYPDIDLTNLTDKMNENILSISIYEKFFKMQTLNDYLTKNIDDLDNNTFIAILMQIIHTLYIIRTTYPKFNHNLLNINNVFVYNIEKNDHKLEYSYENSKFVIPATGVITKIFNFDIAETESENEDDIKTLFNSLTTNQKINNYIKKNINVKNFIITYINMKPEEIMFDKKKNNQTGGNNDSITGTRKLYKQYTTNQEHIEKTIPDYEQVPSNRMASALGVNKNEMNYMMPQQMQQIPTIPQLPQMQLGQYPMNMMPQQQMQIPQMSQQQIPISQMQMPQQQMPQQQMPQMSQQQMQEYMMQNQMQQTGGSKHKGKKGNKFFF